MNRNNKLKKFAIVFLIISLFTNLAFTQAIKQGDVTVTLVNDHKVVAIDSPSKRYSVLFATDYQNPEVALAYLDYDECTGTGRSETSFKVSNAPKSVKVRSNWYTNTGYDRGHLISNDFFNFDETLSKETFTIYNICPQLPELNRKGVWRKLEEATEKAYANADGRIYEIVGPILSEEPENYKKLGNTNCVIPESFYKIILVQDLKDETYEFTRIEVWIFYNTKSRTPNGELILTNKEDSIENVLNWIENQLQIKITLD